MSKLSKAFILLCLILPSLSSNAIRLRHLTNYLVQETTRGAQKDLLNRYHRMNGRLPTDIWPTTFKATVHSSLIKEKQPATNPDVSKKKTCFMKNHMFTGNTSKILNKPIMNLASNPSSKDVFCDETNPITSECELLHRHNEQKITIFPSEVVRKPESLIFEESYFEQVESNPRYEFNRPEKHYQKISTAYIANTSFNGEKHFHSPTLINSLTTSTLIGSLEGLAEQTRPRSWAYQPKPSPLQVKNDRSFTYINSNQKNGFFLSPRWQHNILTSLGNKVCYSTIGLPPTHPECKFLFLSPARQKQSWDDFPHEEWRILNEDLHKIFKALSIYKSLFPDAYYPSLYKYMLSGTTCVGLIMTSFSTRTWQHLNIQLTVATYGKFIREIMEGLEFVLTLDLNEERSLSLLKTYFTAREKEFQKINSNLLQIIQISDT